MASDTSKAEIFQSRRELATSTFLAQDHRAARVWCQAERRSGSGSICGNATYRELDHSLRMMRGNRIILFAYAENTLKPAALAGSNPRPKEARRVPWHPTVSLMRSRQREGQARLEPASEPILHPEARRRRPRWLLFRRAR